MKKNKLLLIIFLFFLTIILVFCGNKKSNAMKKSDHPLMIENLRLRNVTNKILSKEKLSSETKLFKSYIASYYSDGFKQYTLLNIPKTAIPKNGYPVIVVNHGHIPPEKYSITKSYQYVSTYYANNGFLVLKPDYRGHDQSEGGENRYINRLSYSMDVLNLLDTISSIKEADNNNVFMYGHSMGGMVTLAVLESTGMIKAATLWSAVSAQFPESSLYFIRKRNPLEADEILKFFNDTFGEENFGKFSPVNYLSYIQCDLIIQHGTKDDSVPYQWSVDLAEKLKENNKYYEFYTYEGDDHNFAKGSFYKVLKKDVDFFKKHITN